MTSNISGFPGLSFHLPVFSLHPPVLLMPDFIIFAISNPFLGPCQSLISAGGKMEKVRLSPLKLISFVCCICGQTCMYVASMIYQEPPGHMGPMVVYLFTSPLLFFPPTDPEFPVLPLLQDTKA